MVAYTASPEHLTNMHVHRFPELAVVSVFLYVYVCGMIKSRRMRLAVHVTRIVSK
jgi:hypothetical protein